MNSRKVGANQAVKFTNLPGIDQGGLRGLVILEDPKPVCIRGSNHAHQPNTLLRSLETNMDNLSLEYRFP
jgi:hypothetical protein